MADGKSKSQGGSKEGRGPTVIYVHGVGDRLKKAPLKREWDLALFGRDMADATRMAYWADVVPRPERTTHPSSPKPDDRGRHALNLEQLFADAGVSEDNSEARTLARALLRTLGVEVGRATNRLDGLMLPAPWRKQGRRAFLYDLIRDSLAYFFQPKVRKNVQECVRKELARTRLPAPDGQSVTIVAHGLGGAIALDVLSSLDQKDKKIVAAVDLITVGTPLGTSEVAGLLACDLQVPRAIDAWYNFSDPSDPMTLDRRIGENFESASPDKTIVDEMVHAREVRNLPDFDPRSAAAYLASPNVRELVHAQARIDPHARFLIARDVAAALASNARQSVLIEILEPGYEAVGESKEDLEDAERKERKRKSDHASAPRGALADRVEHAAKEIEGIVADLAGKEHLNDARVDRLRRFVAARLTPRELDEVAQRHRTLRIYAVWKSNMKQILVDRSARVIQADAARKSYGAFGDRITWAVLDTGVRQDHPHFEDLSTIAAVWDCTDIGPPKPLSEDQDPQGHGTHVAGIIAGGMTVPEGKGKAAKGKQSRKAFEIQGIAPRAKLVVYKVLDNNGCGEDAWIIKALDHIAEQNENSSEIVIHGLNLSLGGPYDAKAYGCGFSPLCVELRRLWRAGALVVVAAGNEGRMRVNTPDGVADLNSSMSIGDPANLEDCIAVGSVNADRPHLYGVSSFSSHGPTSDGRTKPDVVAPGERINSCNSAYGSRNETSKLYRQDSGTSMAAPHVSGMLAAFLSVRREYRGRPDEVKTLLLRTCVDIQRDRYHQGHGIPNLMRMLLEA